MMATRYAFMGGMPGCLPDYHSNFIYDTEGDAKKAAIEFYGLSEMEGVFLSLGWPLYPHGGRYHEIGAGVIEIVAGSIEEEEEEGGNI